MSADDFLKKIHNDDICPGAETCKNPYCQKSVVHIWNNHKITVGCKKWEERHSVKEVEECL
jgi:hypothetical protein